MQRCGKLARRANHFCLSEIASILSRENIPLPFSPQISG
jgi:hypothetical protein